MLIAPNGSSLEKSEKICCFYDGIAYTYEDLYDLSVSYKSQIEPRSVSLLIGSNSIHALAFYLASISTASPLILLPPTVSSDQVSSYLQTFKPRQVFNLLDAKKQIANIDQLSKDLSINKDFHFFDHDRLLPALLLPTSGSTGTRKLVKVSHNNLFSNTASIIDYLDVNSSSRHITSLPFSYTYGLSCINTHISCKASIVLSDLSILDKDLWELAREYHPTTFSGVPYTYETLSRYGKDFLSSLSIRHYTQAGGKLSNKLVKFFHEIISGFGGDFTVMYGQTEATARMSYLPKNALPNKVGSIGVAIPNGNFSLDYSLSLTPIDGFKVGELVYSGPNVTHGYASCIDNLHLTSVSAPDFLRTGDLAYQDEDNYFFIVGRISRFAKVSGIRISLDDLQSFLSSSDIACVSNDKFIYFFHPPSVTSESILKQLIDRFSLPSRTYRFIATDTIPRNESGKIIYSELLDRIS